MHITLRPAEPADDPFLYQVYASTRADELGLVDWSAAQKEAFLRMQFNAQRQSYAMQFPHLDQQVILRDQVPAGRLLVDRGEHDILLVDIAMLPEHRNGGIGTTLIKALQSEAARAGKPLRLHVEFFNPAQRLYERLGFARGSQNGIYVEMIWQAP